MKKGIVLKDVGVVLCVWLLLCMSSCELLDFDFKLHRENSAMLGDALQINQQGYFLTAVTYVSYEWFLWAESEYKTKKISKAYKPDGSYVITHYLFETETDDLNRNSITGEGWIPYYKEWGSYDYSAADYQLTHRRSSFRANLNQGIPHLYNATASAELFPQGSLKKETVICTEHTQAKAYIRDCNDPQTWIYSCEEGTEITTQYVKSLTVTSESLSHTYRLYKQVDPERDSGILAAEEYWRAELLNPITFKQQTITPVTGIYVAYQKRDWDSVAESLGDWQDDPYDTENGLFNKSFYRQDNALVCVEEILDF